MLDFLNKAKNKYHLSLGEYDFSPIMEASIALSLYYIEQNSKNKSKFPFYLNFPEKNLASIWLSVSLLVNFFLEDYINQTGIDEISTFKKGDKIEIFGVVAEIELISKEKILLQFSDQGGIPINKKLRSQVNKTNRKLMNKFTLFKKNYKECKKARNPISRILEPNDPVIINENYLSSKILLITGRNNVKELRSILKTSEIYDEPLNKIFIENKNLLIKKDLEGFKNIFDSNISDKEKLFKGSLLDFLNKSHEIELEVKEDLQLYLETDNFLTITFKDKFDDFLEINSGISPELKKIGNLYPGVKEAIHPNIKALIINDIEQVDAYKDTIAGFLDAGIPILVISDRHIKKSDNLNFLNDHFNKNLFAYRINWNRKKINLLNETCQTNNHLKYLDERLWINSLRYSVQQIKIMSSEPSPLDKLLVESQKIIRTLQKFESIQEAYYKYLFPAAYLFKNSMSKNENVLELLEYFDIELQKNRLYLAKPNFLLLEQIVHFLRNATINTKMIKNPETTFSNLLPVNLNRDIFIPTDCTKINMPSANTESIFFSGYPYNEFSGRYLINAVCSDFVPKIDITCWPIESQLTYNYLKRRILAGYFTDNLHPDWKVPSEIHLKENEDFISEINSFLIYDGDKHKIEEEIGVQENDILAITNFKYKGYNYNADGTSSYRLKCDILNFSDGSFLFLPKNSKVLAQIETDDGSIKFRNSLFSELEVGFNVFKYKKDKKAFRELSRNDSIIKKAFSDLELWKASLMKIYADNKYELKTLETLLLDAKEKNNLTHGNPLKYNIQRWLYDEELIAPDIDNIKIILAASGQKEIEKTIDQIKSAKSSVDGYTLRLSSKIKNLIGRRIEKQFSSIEKEFELDIESVKIHVETRIITSLEKSEIEIEYRNTRKILI